MKPDQDWVWREDRIPTLLATEDAGVLFVSGCAANMGQFLPQFDHIILLSAPAGVIVERLATRTTNDYGKHPDRGHAGAGSASGHRAVACAPSPGTRSTPALRWTKVVATVLDLAT